MRHVVPPFAPLTQIYTASPPSEKKTLTVVFWEGSALKPREDHTLAQNNSIAIIRRNGV